MSSPAFDDSRIKDNPDKRLLRYIRRYFKAFTEGDFNGMEALQAEGYTMTDIPLGVVNTSRATWFDTNKNFVALMTDLKVVALTLYGSSAPGHFSIMEHAVSFKLAVDPPPQAAPRLPPGAKAGDTVGMINISCLWWDYEGRCKRELEYGRLKWENFDIMDWDQVPKEDIGLGIKGLLSKL